MSKIKKFINPDIPEEYRDQAKPATLCLTMDGEPIYDREADFRDVLLQIADETGGNSPLWLAVARLAKKYLDIKEAIDSRPGDLLKELLKTKDDEDGG